MSESLEGGEAEGPGREEKDTLFPKSLLEDMMQDKQQWEQEDRSGNEPDGVPTIRVPEIMPHAYTSPTRASSNANDVPGEDRSPGESDMALYSYDSPVLDDFNPSFNTSLYHEAPIRSAYEIGPTISAYEITSHVDPSSPGDNLNASLCNEAPTRSAYEMTPYVDPFPGGNLNAYQSLDNDKSPGERETSRKDLRPAKGNIFDDEAIKREICQKFDLEDGSIDCLSDTLDVIQLGPGPRQALPTRIRVGGNGQNTVYAHIYEGHRRRANPRLTLNEYDENGDSIKTIETQYNGYKKFKRDHPFSAMTEYDNFRSILFFYFHLAFKNGTLTEDPDIPPNERLKTSLKRALTEIKKSERTA